MSDENNEEEIINIPTRDELEKIVEKSKSEYKNELKQRLRRRVAEISENEPCFFTLSTCNYWSYPAEVRKAAVQELCDELNLSGNYSAICTRHDETLLVLVHLWMTEKRCVVESRNRTLVAGLGPAVAVFVAALVFFVLAVMGEIYSKQVRLAWIFFIGFMFLFGLLLKEASSRLARMDEQREFVAMAKKRCGLDANLVVQQALK